MSIFTPEQQTEIDKQIAQVKSDLDAKYTARATGFRTWLRTKDQVWVAQRTATALIATEAFIAFGVWWVFFK